MKTRVLVLDDEPNMTTYIERILSEAGLEVRKAVRPEEALETLAAWRPEILLTDVRMPGMSGIEVLRRAKRADPRIEVVVLTAYGNVEGAVEAVREGAYDYLTKPFEPERLERTVLHAAERRRIFWGLDAAEAETGLADVVAESPAMRRILALVRRVAPTDATVLVTGETGTGKEVVARAVHALSRRAARVFRAASLAAVPETLQEAELFGHKKGSFTGAVADRKGLFAQADGGTVLLDEIGDSAPALQAKLLRVLQEGEYYPVGAARPERCDVRVVAATNRDLEADVAAGRFRQDLYFRLAVMPIHLPPLRARTEDVRPLSLRFLRTAAEKNRKDVAAFSPEATAALEAHRWPGNVRELASVVERAVIVASGRVIEPRDLIGLPAAAAPEGALPGGVSTGPYEESVAAFERAYFTSLLKRNEGNVAAAARAAGITRRTLYDRIARLGLDVGVFRSM